MHVREQRRGRITGLLSAAAFLALLASGAALADPPGRVARLSQIAGTVSFSPAGEEDWVLAQANRPLIAGDRVWADAGSRAELQIGPAAVRLGAETSVNILSLDDRIAQFQLAQGALNVRVRRISGDQVFEVDTPNLAFSIRRPGEYRIEVDPAGNATTVRVRGGEGEAWGEGAGYVIGAGQQYTFLGTGLRDYSTDPLPPPDDFDRWASDRDRREEGAVAARYVSPDVIGYSDLDDYGQWRTVENYGNVWVPTQVAADWAPYHYGHWAWVDPWGWTWIDDAPWGFAPFHYGRWAYLSSRWCWVPGPIRARPVYAPALVAFFGGPGGFSLSLSAGPVAGVAWFPLGPGEVYRPSYAVSRGYFTNVNVSNTVVNTTVINNVYNNVNVTNVVYRNREVAGAVTAVPATAFAGGQPVARASVAVPRERIERERVVPVAAVAPSHNAVLGAGAAVAAGAAAAAIIKRPPPAALARPAVAKVAPAPLPPSFASKQSLLATQPGKPLEAEKLNTLKPARTSTERNVKLAAPAGAAAPTLKPLPPGKVEERKGPPPQANVPQPPKGQEAMREERKGPPAQANVPQPPKGQEAMREERKGPPPQANVPQPPKGQEALREERKGPPPQANVPQPPKGQEAMREERKGPPPQANVPQPPKGQERFVQESKGPSAGPPPGPPPGAQIRQVPPPPQQQQQQVQQERQQQQQKAGKGEPNQEEGKQKGKEKEKEKEKEKKEGQQ